MATAPDSFTAFVSGRGAALVRFAFLLTGDEYRAEDLVQSAFARTLPRWKSLERPEAAEAYVRAVVVNLNRAWWRRRHNRESVVADVQELPANDATEQVADWDRLRRALGTLSPGQRTAVVLRFYEDLPEQQVAQIMRCSVGTVKSHASRGLERLRTALEQADEEERGHVLDR